MLDRRRYLRHPDHPEHYAGDSKDEFELSARAWAAIEAPGKRLMKPMREPIFGMSSLSSLAAKKNGRFFFLEAGDNRLN